MKEELNLPTPYKVFKVYSDSEPSYEFTTKNDTVYGVVFMSGESYFPNIEVCKGRIFMLNFDIKEEVVEKRAYDGNIEITIAEIVISFFNSIENVMLFVCDSTDSRQRHRKITFNKWYNNHKEKLNIVKIDFSKPYYISMISREDNQFLPKLYEVINDQIEEFSEIEK
jgi:hypothetical protein